MNLYFVLNGFQISNVPSAINANTITYSNGEPEKTYKISAIINIMISLFNNLSAAIALGQNYQEISNMDL